MIVGITGATGFLGQRLCKILTRSGHQVVGWSRNEQPPGDGQYSPCIEWVMGQLGDPEVAQQFAQRVDAIVHAAVDRQGTGFVGTPNDPIEYYQVNVIGSLQLLQTATQHHIKRFVFVSSGAVHGRVIGDGSLNELHPLWPTSLYGAAKAAVETLIHRYGLEGQLDCCTLRPTSIYGLRQPLSRTRWLDLISDVASGKDVSPSGGNKTVHVDDVAEAIELLLTTQAKIAGETFNCCDRWVGHHEIAEITKEITGSTSQILGSPKHPANTIDTTKLEQLGFQFGGTVKLRDTISKIIHAINQM